MGTKFLKGRRTLHCCSLPCLFFIFMFLVFLLCILCVLGFVCLFNKILCYSYKVLTMKICMVYRYLCPLKFEIVNVPSPVYHSYSS